MTDKINFKMLKPFGSTLAKAELPLKLVSEFLKDLKEIRGDKEKSKTHDFGHHLVGAVKNEFLITPKLMLKWKQDFFNPVIKTYAEHHYPNKIAKKIIILSAWYVVSVSGDYNPQHSHTNFGKAEDKQPHLSCVGYLNLPAQMKDEKSHEKQHHRTNGHIEFNEGSEGIFTNALHMVKPEVRDWYLFPCNLRHSVYPFFGDGERISFSFNAKVEFENRKMN